MKIKQFIGAVSALAVSAMPFVVSDSLSAYAEKKAVTNSIFLGSTAQTAVSGQKIREGIPL